MATNSLKRSALAPSIPAISERVPNFDFAVIVVALAPTGTSSEIVKLLSQEIAKISKNEDVIKTMNGAGIEMVGGGPEALKTALDAERARGAAAVKQAGIKPE